MLVIVIAVTLRGVCDVAALGPRFDEQWIRVPIDGILRDGWSVRTAIDFEETKGPGMIWPYAALGAIVGGTLADLRWITVACFVAGVVPLLLLARRAGVVGAGLVAVAALYCLLPQQLVLGQLVMSEPLFVTTTLFMLLAFVWGFARERGWTGATASVDGRATMAGLGAVDGRGAHPVAGPILYGVLLSVALHNRVHAVAFAAACCIVAMQRDGRGAWPWWLATALAGLSRVPLWLRWGGLASPMYRDMHHLGGGATPLVQWSNATYLLAALVPWTAVLLWPAWRGSSPEPAVGVGPIGRRIANDPDRAAARWWIAAGAALGAILGALAPPALASRVPPPAAWAERVPEGLVRYLGFAASAARAAGASIVVQSIVLGALATLGAASLAALGALSWRSRRADASPETDERLLGRLTFWTLASGIGLYSTTQAFGTDRYILPWAALMPILWWRWLPRWLLALFAMALLAMAAQQVRGWLT